MSTYVGTVNCSCDEIARVGLPGTMAQAGFANTT
jgi:hypothetical protein